MMNNTPYQQTGSITISEFDFGMESSADLFLLRWTECPTEENKSS